MDLIIKNLTNQATNQSNVTEELINEINSSFLSYLSSLKNYCLSESTFDLSRDDIVNITNNYKKFSEKLAVFSENINLQNPQIESLNLGVESKNNKNQITHSSFYLLNEHMLKQLSITENEEELFQNIGRSINSLNLVDYENSDFNVTLKADNKTSSKQAVLLSKSMNELKSSINGAFIDINNDINKLDVQNKIYSNLYNNISKNEVISEYNIRKQLNQYKYSTLPHLNEILLDDNKKNKLSDYLLNNKNKINDFYKENMKNNNLDALLFLNDFFNKNNKELDIFIEKNKINKNIIESYLDSTSGNKYLDDNSKIEILNLLNTKLINENKNILDYINIGELLNKDKSDVVMQLIKSGIIDHSNQNLIQNILDVCIGKDSVNVDIKKMLIVNELIKNDCIDLNKEYKLKLPNSTSVSSRDNTKEDISLHDYLKNNLNNNNFLKIKLDKELSEVDDPEKRKIVRLLDSVNRLTEKENPLINSNFESVKMLGKISEKIDYLNEWQLKENSFTRSAVALVCITTLLLASIAFKIATKNKEKQVLKIIDCENNKIEKVKLKYDTKTKEIEFLIKSSVFQDGKLHKIGTIPYLVSNPKIGSDNLDKRAPLKVSGTLANFKPHVDTSHIDDVEYKKISGILNESINILKMNESKLDKTELPKMDNESDYKNALKNLKDNLVKEKVDNKKNQPVYHKKINEPALGF